MNARLTRELEWERKRDGGSLFNWEDDHAADISRTLVESKFDKTKRLHKQMGEDIAAAEKRRRSKTDAG